MGIYDSDSTSSTVPELTSTLANDIYSYIKEFNKFTDAFTASHNYTYTNLNKVWKDVLKVKREIDHYMTGGYVVEEAEYDKDGNLTKEAVYSPTTKTNLKNTMKELSVSVNTDTIVDDYMDGMSISEFEDTY